MNQKLQTLNLDMKLCTSIVNDRMYVKEVVLILFFLLVVGCSLTTAQKVVADTLLISCSGSGSLLRREQNQFMYSSQEELDNSPFATVLARECNPFENIDFENHILVGYIYQGSNCDKKIISAVVEQTESNHYKIGFKVRPNVCRDLRINTAWFIVTRPRGKFTMKATKLR